MQKRIVRILLLILSLHFLNVSCLQAETSESIIRSTLKNGLRVVIVKNELAPVVAVQMNYLVGANDDPHGFPGTAHAQEHMMFRGSPGLSAAQMSAIIANLGGEFNATTQQTITQYSLTVPDADLDVALHVEAVRMRGVLDSQTLWQRERGAIEQEVAQDLSNPEYVYYTKLRTEVFRDTPYAHDALGTRASFDKMTGGTLKKFHKQWYGPNNAILVIVGNVEPYETLKKVKRLFEAIPARTVPPHPRVQLKPMRAATINLETDLPYGLAILTYRLPGYESPDYAAGQILGDILESKRGNIYALVPQGKALSVDVSIETLPKAAIGYVAAAYPQGDDGNKLILTMKDIVDEYSQNGFPSELVEAAKHLEIANNELQKNSVEGLASLWSQTLAIEDRRSPEEDIDEITKVTVEDVNRVAKTYLVNDTAITAVLEPYVSGKAVPSASSMGKESFVSRQTRHVKLPSWAKKADSIPALPTSKLNPEVTILSNGMRLIILPENVSDTVSVYGKIKNNPEMQAPEGQEGVDRVLNSLFSHGTKTLDRLAFQKALDDIAAKESAGSSFSLEVLAKNFDKGIQLLADNMLHPALPEDAFRVVQQETRGELSGLLQSPSYLSKRAMINALYPKDDPTLRQATTETVAKLTLDDVRNYYLKVFRPDMTTIVIIGRVTPDQAKSIILKYFGNWKAEGLKLETDLPPVPSNKSSSAVIPDASRVQDNVTLAETLRLTRLDPDYYTLQVGRHVLSGAFYATRLYQDLRERTGLVYSVEAVLEAGKHRSLFGVIYASDPQNVAKARTIVEHDLTEMQTKLVSPMELRQAKTLLIRQISLSEASVKSIAARLLHYSMADLPLDEHVQAARRYMDITASDVRLAFAKWIRLDDLVQITVGPNPE